MFELNEKLKKLDITADKVLRLKRSLGDIQIALPGQKSQKATAYICAFKTGKGARVAIALFMRADYKLVFYLNGGGEFKSSEASTVLKDAVHFTESLGFMMDDLEAHKVSDEKKAKIWDSLPLKNPPAKPQPKEEVKPVTANGQPAVVKQAEVVEEIVDAEELDASESVELDLGLPRRQLASTPQKKVPPTPEEIEQKRERLRKNMGRFLASF